MMSSIGYAGSSMFTLMSRSHASQTAGPSHTRHAQDLKNLRLSLNTVIGTTTGSVNAFDALPEHHTYACCAGSAAVLARVDEHLNITQRLFRVRPNAAPINATPSFYNPATPPSTPGKSRHGSPLKDGGCGIVYNGLQDHPSNSSSQVRANNRSRETSCVSLSRGGNLMAVGETGYNPRVLIFSTASSSPSDVPLSILSDHSFGISSVAFSEDSRWLCTLGNKYDGFILIYSINAKTGSAKLHSSNKCSNVHRVVWMGHSVISIGVRHAKVWRLEMDNIGIAPSKLPALKAFAGRNCLLGPLMDATFTSVAVISDYRAFLCTDQGDIVLLDDSDETQQLKRVAHVDFSILCAVFDCAYGLVWIGGKDGNSRSIPLDALIKPTIPTFLPTTTWHFSSTVSDTVPDIIAIGFVRGRAVIINSHRIIEIRRLVDTEGASVMESDFKRLPAHESAVLGVSSLLPKNRDDGPDFLTFSARGSVLFWLFDGTCTGSIKIPLDQPVYPEDGDTNDLKIVVPLMSDEHLVSGDRMGILRLIDRSTDKEAAVQAHSGDINSIAVANTEGLTLVATCGRDRTLQLFRRHQFRLDLLQTLDDHESAVSDVKFLDKTTLISISSDRTIIVRKLAFGKIAFLPTRIITLKASPVSLAAVPALSNVVLVSTLDRQVCRYNVSSGRLLHSFKASDPTTGDSLLMSSLEVHEVGHLPTAPRLILGVSSTDKSIRVHEYDSGAMLTREGQNSVSALKLFRQYVEGDSPRDHLVSCGLDGTVMIWALSCNSPKSSASHDTPNSEESPSRQITPAAQPLRRILSKAELSDLQKSLSSKSDKVTPIPGSSPSCVRRKSSRYSAVAAPKISASAPPHPAGALPSPADARVQRQLSQSHSPKTPSGQKITLKSRSKTSLDGRRRSKSAANLNDLNGLGEQICVSLRTFRSRITSSSSSSSSVAKLEHNTLPELIKELNITIRALADKNYSGGDVLDMYPPTVINEKLDMKAKSNEITFVHSPRSEETGLGKLGVAHVAEEEEALE